MFFLSDPTPQIEAVAKSKGQEYRSLALGQGQEEAARKMLTESKMNGYWMVLQNCHLCLDFCEELIQNLLDYRLTNKNFRLWITTEVNKNFPIGLLQMSLKFTNEPPQDRPLSSHDSPLCTTFPLNPQTTFNESVYYSLLTQRKCVRR